MSKESLRELEPMVHDEFLDAMPCAVPESTVDVVAPNAALVDDLLCFYPSPVKESVPKRLVHGAHVRRPVRVGLREVVEVRGPFGLNDLVRIAGGGDMLPPED